MGTAVTGLIPYPSTHIIYPFVSTELSNKNGSRYITFEQVFSVTFIFSRRLNYSQLPLLNLHLLWLSVADKLASDSECLFGNGVKIATNKLDPIDILPASNNTDWLVTLRFSFEVSSYLELESIFEPVPILFNGNITTVTLNTRDNLLPVTFSETSVIDLI